jgi:hypothetical protein
MTNNVVNVNKFRDKAAKLVLGLIASSIAAGLSDAFYDKGMTKFRIWKSK